MKLSQTTLPNIPGVICEDDMTAPKRMAAELRAIARIIAKATELCGDEGRAII